MSAWKQLLEDILGSRRGAPETQSARAARASRDTPETPFDTIRDVVPPVTEEQASFGQSSDAVPAPVAVSPGPKEGTERPGPSLVVGIAIGGIALLIGLFSVGSTVVAAKQRLLKPTPDSRPGIALAQEAEVGYCTADFKQVLERVLHSCGLAAQSERRACKPSDIKTFAAISDGDFNSLFLPLQQRGGVIMFDDGSDVLDAAGKALLEKRWFERKGARYFFVVARASKTGNPEKNRALSHRRANSVLFHLKEVSGETEAELNQKVGLLWLGNEYAQLPAEYCGWPRSREASKCDEEAVNRSAFVSWVDCRL